MSEGKIVVERRPEQPGALYLEFNNPDSLNAFTVDMWRQLIRQLKEAGEDPGVRAVILRGAGTRAFSAGLAMEMLDGLCCEADYALIYDLGREIRDRIIGLDKPVIAAVQGSCVGGGLEIALCCDLVYAADDAKFGLPEGNIGLTPGCGGAINLPKKIPANRAMEMVIFSGRMRAEEAKACGFVNQVFPKAEFDARLYDIVDQLLTKAPLALRGVKALHACSFAGDEAGALAVERKLALELMSTQDFKNAVKAFREKRAPVFKGE